MIEGLVVGKFYPLHKGHQYVIDTAIEQTDHVTIILCSKSGEWPDGDERASWITELYPDATLIHFKDRTDIPDDDSVMWAEKTLKVVKPDTVFGSEDYLDRYSVEMTVKSGGLVRRVMVDRNRVKYPISGTEIRRSPREHWDQMDPVVRASYVLRVCLIGAESTGKTTLAKKLAKHYGAIWVPEYGRDYSLWKEERTLDVWNTEDFKLIARTQNYMEDFAARNSGPVMICDTDAFVTAMWHERYLHEWSDEVMALARPEKMVYLLSVVEGAPLVYDGLREIEPYDDDEREWMEKRYIEELDRMSEVMWGKLSGTWDERFEAAKWAIDMTSRGVPI